MSDFCIKCGEVRQQYHKCDPERIKARHIEMARRVILEGGTTSEKIFYKSWYKKKRHQKHAV
jgi:hypothetical protein